MLVKHFSALSCRMAPSKHNHVEAYLDIFDFEDLTHEQISEMLGLQPSRIHVKGQRHNPNFGRLAPRNRWMLQMYTKEGPWLNIEEQLDELLALVTLRRVAFQQLAAHCKFAIKCAVKVYVQHNESTPAVFLEHRHVELLTFLQATFDVDIYCYATS